LKKIFKIFLEIYKKKEVIPQIFYVLPPKIFQIAFIKK